MQPRIIYVPSAFKHRVTVEDICRVLAFPEYEGPLEDDDSRRIVIGFGNNGNLLEVLYNQLDEQTVKVFHAMKCRSIYYHLLPLK